MSIPHGECISLPRFLALPGYCPTVQYVYRMCPQTRACMDVMSFDELVKCQNFKVLEPTTCDMSGDIRTGALLILNKNPLTGEKKNWTHWTGSVIGLGTMKYFSPTVIQVGTGVLTAMKYCVMHPNRGALYSEDLPSEWVVECSKPFMGKVLSEPVGWSPESTQFADLVHVREGGKKMTLSPEKISNDILAKKSQSVSDSDSTGESADEPNKALIQTTEAK